MRSRAAALVALWVTATSPHASAAPCAVTSPIGFGDDEAHDLAVLADGSVLVAGSAYNGANLDFALARYTPSLALDMGFASPNGYVLTGFGSGHDVAHALAVQPDGKIVLAGYATIGGSRDLALARFDASGVLDFTFDGDGQTTLDVGGFHDEIHDVLLQPDGNIVVVGRSHNGTNYDLLVARFTPGGQLDMTFNGSGFATLSLGPLDESASAVALQLDGRIVIAGTYSGLSDDDFLVVRYHSDGTRDMGFAGGAFTQLGGSFDAARDLVIQPDGKILVVGESFGAGSADFMVMRLDPDGSFDAGFNGFGFVAVPVAVGQDGGEVVLLQPDGKIVVAGYADDGGGFFDMAVLRLLSNGALDPSFAGDGIATLGVLTTGSVARAAGFGPDGSLFVAGRVLESSADFAVSRLNADGSSPCRNLFLHPIAPGSTSTFTSASGCTAGSRWDCVNDQPLNEPTGDPAGNNGTSSFLRDVTAGGREMFALLDGSIPPGATAVELRIRAWMGRGGGTAHQARLSYQRLGFDPVVIDGPQFSVFSSCCLDSRTWIIPGIHWSGAELDALEIGLIHTQGGETDVSQLHVEVSYLLPPTKVNYRSIGIAPAYNLGTVGTTTGSPVVTGAGTSWKSANRGPGDRITIDGFELTVLSVDSETQLTLTEPFFGTTASGKLYSISRQFPNLSAWEDCVGGGACFFFPVASPSLVDDNRKEVGVVFDDGMPYAPFFIDGAVTDSAHDIVLTASPSSRHLGKADEGVVLDGGGFNPGIVIWDDHVTIDGLEIRNASSGISILGQSSGNRVILRNNVIHAVNEGIVTNEPDAVLEIYNNIVYEAVTGMSLGGISQAEVSNNTVYQCGTGGITGFGGAIALRNNLAHSCGSDFNVSGVTPPSSHNLSGDGSASVHSPGGGGQVGVPLAAVGFVSTLAGAEDLHITASSAALDAGTSVGWFSHDVDDGLRSTPWDVGADELGAPAPSRTNYFSIGIDTGVLVTDIASIPAGSDVVLFSSALPPNVGIGDKLVLDPGGPNEEVFYVLSRVSSTELQVQAPATFGHPTQSATLRRAFHSLQEWETARQGNLSGEKRREVGVLYDDGPLGAGVVIDGSATDASHHMTLTVAPSERHQGLAGTGARADGSLAPPGEIVVADDYSRVEWLEVKNVPGAGIRVAAANVLLRQLLIHHNGTGVRIAGTGGASFTLQNSILFSNLGHGIEGNQSGDAATVENCTLYGNGISGIDQGAGTFFDVRNTISMDNGSFDFSIPGGSQLENVSSDGTAIPHSFASAANELANPGGEDFHLRPGAVSVDAGTDLSSQFTDDIDDEVRPALAGWDIGADELGTGAGSPSLSSLAHQSFVVGSAPTMLLALTVTESLSSATINALDEIRIRIPAGFPMRFDTTATDVLVGGPEGFKVDPGIKAYEDFGRTLVLDVTADFEVGDSITIDEIRVWSFTAPAPAARLELEVGNDDLVCATDDKTLTILADAFPTLSSDAHQVFTHLQSPVAALPFTITAGTSTTVGSAIRIHIPAGFAMEWDPSVGTIDVSGPGASHVDPTGVSYADSDTTLVIPVLSDFGFGDHLRVSGPRFKGFSLASPVNSLWLEVGVSMDVDDKTIVIQEASDVLFFTATATNQQVKLEWRTPKSGECDWVRILARDDGIEPGDPNDGRLVDERQCELDTKDSVLDDMPALVNGNLYAYAAFVEYNGIHTSGEFVKARPMDTTLEPVQWAYSTGFTSLAAPGVRHHSGSSYVYTASNEGVLHAIRGGPSGGDWPAGWTPYAFGSPAQARPPVVFFPIGSATEGAVFLGAQNGNVYAVDASQGSELWRTPVATRVQAAPAGHFKFVDLDAGNVIMVGTRNDGGPNTLEALDAVTGAPAWTFDNSSGQMGGDGTNLGTIHGSATVDYFHDPPRLLFGSRQSTTANPSLHTLWCLDIENLSLPDPPPPKLLWSVDIGDVDGSPVLYGGVVYVVNRHGILYAMDPADGSVNWSHDLGDGAIKGFVFPQYGSNRLLVSTQTTLWSIEDTGGGHLLHWQVGSPDVPSPSTPTFVPGTGKILVGSSDGHLYQLDVDGTLPALRVKLGDGTSVVGTPTVDIRTSMIYVGTDEGVIYGIRFPLLPP